jgi:N-acetylmuramoyl-L-alanine amidase
VKRVVVAAAASLTLAACTAAVPHAFDPAPPRSAPGATHAAPPPSAASSPDPPSSAARHRSHRATRTSAPVTTSPAPASTPPSSPSATAATRSAKPVIVLDPGHSVTIEATDPANDLNVSDYENEPEMHDVFAVALIVRRRLEAAGYRVVMTKKTVDQRASLLHRAQVANRVHAALALSIHDQAGSNGGIGFDQGNNTVYYQSVGGYRVNERGRRIVFRNHRVARISRRFGHIFRRQRAAAEHHAVALRDNVGYNLGSRGLPAGDMWMVQLLSHVPWIYNEAGGNSAGRVGLSAADKRLYAAGLVAAVEHCVPLRHGRSG